MFQLERGDQQGQKRKYLKVNKEEKGFRQALSDGKATERGTGNGITQSPLLRAPAQVLAPHSSTALPILSAAGHLTAPQLPRCPQMTEHKILIKTAVCESHQSCQRVAGVSAEC
ncbi:hypothetical protein CEXT_335891 [Caerostris extrusa]|uniref:Uncharacterized protein n=1 Tax=Caerostris extrusa TaxID=172846 RepID=A0AAV4M4A7_CAEEX|nr:hypothetical protein CEXT_335891 [Caerostris extrusa]